jgi:hypothetical protein
MAATRSYRYFPGEIDSFEDRLGYITNQEIRGILSSLLSDLPNWGKDKILIEPIKYAISVKIGGKVFMHLALPLCISLYGEIIF